MSEYLDNLSKTRKKAYLKVEEENYLNLWGYMRRRYPNSDLENLDFLELISLKNALEGPRMLRFNDGEIASVRKR